MRGGRHCGAPGGAPAAAAMGGDARAAGCALVAEMDALMGVADGRAAAAQQEGVREAEGDAGGESSAAGGDDLRRQEPPQQQQRRQQQQQGSGNGSAGVAAYQCGCVDVQTVSNVCAALTMAVAEAAVAARSGFNAGSNGSTDDALALRGPLEARLRERGAALAATDRAAAQHGSAVTRPAMRTLANLKTEMEAFVTKHRGFVSAISSYVGHPKQDAAALAARLEQAQDGWPSAQRAALARDLVRLYDGPASAHCTMAFASEGELAAHRASCQWAPVTCTNAKCNAVMSRCRAATHAASCGFKVLPCSAGCGASVLRRDMQAHLAGACPKRAVACPFAAFGCTEEVSLGTLEKHLEERQPVHLQMVAAHSKQQESGRIDLGEKLVALGGQLLDLRAAHARALQARNKEHDSLAKQVARLQSELSSARSDTARLQSELAALKRNQNSVVDTVRGILKQQQRG